MKYEIPEAAVASTNCLVAAGGGGGGDGDTGLVPAGPDPPPQAVRHSVPRATSWAPKLLFKWPPPPGPFRKFVAGSRSGATLSFLQFS
jgi:hypothetical protein